MVSRYVPLFDARLAIGAFVLRVCGQSGYFCPAIFWILDFVVVSGRVIG